MDSLDKKVLVVIIWFITYLIAAIWTNTLDISNGLFGLIQFSLLCLYMSGLYIITGIFAGWWK